MAREERPESRRDGADERAAGRSSVGQAGKVAQDVAARNRVVYEALYADESASASYEVRNKTRIVGKLTRKLGSYPERVLDIGFGTGDNLALFARSETALVGVEPIRTPIAMLRRHRPSLRMQGVVADAQSLPFLHGVFDLVVFSHVLEHLSDEAAALAEVRRVLRPDGYAVVLVPCKDIEKNPLHVRRYDRRAISAACTCAGLMPIRYVAVGSRVLEMVLRLLLRLAGGLETAQASPANRRRFPGLRQRYHRLVVPLMLVLSPVDDLVASLQRQPLEVGLLVRRSAKDL